MPSTIKRTCPNMGCPGLVQGDGPCPYPLLDEGDALRLDGDALPPDCQEQNRHNVVKPMNEQPPPCTLSLTHIACKA